MYEPPLLMDSLSVENRSIYVHRVTRGFKRWFFSVSVPLELIDNFIEHGRDVREPELVGRDIALWLERQLCKPRGD